MGYSFIVANGQLVAFFLLVVLSIVILKVQRRLYPHGSIKKTIIFPRLVQFLSSSRYEKLTRFFHWFMRPFWKMPTLLIWVAVDDPCSFIILQTVSLLMKKGSINAVILVVPPLCESSITEKHLNWILKDSMAYACLYSDLVRPPSLILSTDESRIRSATYCMINAV
jgi:hypothetical protein